ncbi:hypothetical protein [Acidihalobacter ferrooxydans]|uniref:hypothetical protein n=1 Tax=Acidihalobacter ferrooxydans TaxID=1765967 RepID=UPI0012EB0F8B|nr:hypothetical protein [Acidihalobacter ferrooxydans]
MVGTVLLVLAAVLYHMGSSATDAAQQRAAQADTVRLKSTINPRLATERKVQTASLQTALVLSALKKTAAITRVSETQISISGMFQNASNQQDLEAAAKSAPGMPGLKVVSVRISGSWQTLPGLRAWLATLDTRPVRITSLDVSQGSFIMGFNIYGR